MEPSSKNGERLWMGVSVVLVLLMLAGGAYMVFSGSGDDMAYGGGGNCNVTAIDIHGCIATYTPDPNLGYDSGGCDAYASSEQIAGYLRDLETDDSVRAVLLDIDSPGGAPQAALEIEEAVKDTGKPTVALIRGYGDSAAYWVATAAKTIIASPESDIGSIGVTSSFTDNAKQNAELGITYHSLSTGKYKDIGDPNKPLTEDEKAQIQKSIFLTFERFIKTVSDNRGMPIERVRELADGSSWLGEEALSLGLIDKLGTYKDAIAEIEVQIGGKAVVCWPQYSGGEDY
jgi:protease-4